MKKPVSIKDIAMRAGVSSSTVSHVLNKTRYVGPETTMKVMQAIEDTNYRRNMLARALRQQKTNSIGIIVPNINVGSFYGRTLSSIESYFKKYGYRIIIQASNNDPEYEEELIHHLLSWNIDGLIIIPSNNNYDYSQISCPIVLIERESNFQTVSGVYIDNYQISKYCTKKIIESGHTKIGFMGATPQYSPTINRLKGYKDALLESNLPIESKHIFCSTASVENGSLAIQHLLENSDITSIIIASSPMTSGAMNFLNRNNILIPDRIGIIAFANTEWMPLCNPALNGIIQPNDELGLKAAELLYETIKGKKELHRLFLPCQYVLGKSL